MEPVSQTVGLDQGCPLSPGLFSVTAKGPLEQTLAHMRTEDPQSMILSYLDDTYLVGSGAAVAKGLQAFREAMQDIGLQLNESKTKIWLAADESHRTTELPADMRQYVVHDLKVVGAVLSYARADRADQSDEWRDVELLSTQTTTTGSQFLSRQSDYLDRLRGLHQHGLELHHVLTLLRTWATGATVHIQRALPMPQSWSQKVDQGITDFLGELLNERVLTPETRRLMHLGLKEGSATGIPSCEQRSEAAWVGAWEGGFSQVANLLGLNSILAFRTAWPQWATMMDQCEQTLHSKSQAPLDPRRWERYASGHQPVKRQKHHADAVKLSACKSLRASLSPQKRFLLTMGSGPESSAFLHPEVEPLGDTHLRACLRMKLLMDDPVPNPNPAAGCQHRGASGRLCGTQCTRDGGHHARTCPLGGGVIRRHDAIRDALHQWLQEYGFSAQKEQRVIHWCTAEREARLDVTVSAQNRSIHLDVSCVDSAQELASSGSQHAIGRRERAKHTRYPGPALTAFVLDTRGAWGREARAFLHNMLRHMSEDTRGAARLRCRQLVSRALHSATADQMLSSAHPKHV